ncbi:hypothetical protein F5148DRAFT_1002144 [Russula earlei]|uniref:Uncharacterized protein n=1 Tax=Russula earlei TaxID=71964 RepID=A0ACC0U1R0_9AGAM|nr:hypothetical protein F5148DRAFT_1002144 [Russula earlei]
MDSFGVNEAATSNELFLERLDAFTTKTLADIKAFSARENIPYDQVRRHVAEKHSQYLFSDSTPTTTRHNNIRNILLSTSRALESLHATAGVQSFVLAVNPNDTEDEGFLGGSPLGREFWRSLRGGGMAGVKALKSLAISTFQDSSPSSHIALHGTGIPFRQRETAHSLKSDVYARARTLLRHVLDTLSTSGIRNAEMKWTNHGNLSVYGVRLEGWPTGIPMQNPSTLSISQNRELRDALASGALRFCRINAEASTPSDAVDTLGSAGNSGDLSWAILEEFDTLVSPDADTDRVTYHEEPTDYFPGFMGANPSEAILRVQERVNPVSSIGQNEPALRGETNMARLDVVQSRSKRQKLDGG